MARRGRSGDEIRTLIENVYGDGVPGNFTYSVNVGTYPFNTFTNTAISTHAALALAAGVATFTVPRTAYYKVEFSCVALPGTAISGQHKIQMKDASAVTTDLFPRLWYLSKGYNAASRILLLNAGEVYTFQVSVNPGDPGVATVTMLNPQLTISAITDSRRTSTY